MGEIFNISSSLPFLETLAKGVLEKFPNIEDVTIYLPTRRASRPLAEAFYKLAGENSLILPKILTIGDVDEEELYIRYFPEVEDVPPAIGESKRLYEIARLINEREKILDVRPDFAQSLALAKSLIQLIDELQNKRLELDALNNVVPEDFAEHWQVTLDFLKIISEDWQNYLTEHNLLEPVKRRNLLIEKLAAYYINNPPDKPVIIAGTTGSIPSTVELVKSVLLGENGYLVLDGLDRNLKNDDFKILEETHPQYNLSRLLQQLKYEPENVREWENVELTSRQKLISTAMFPTERTPEWKDFECDSHDLHLIEAGNLEEEAMAIALVLRETLEQADKTAIVVTNNRVLAERISAKMKIWDVQVDDSAGVNLIHLPTSIFLLEMAEVIRSRQSPIQLLSFFKHPYISAEKKNQIREIETEYLRGPRIEGFDIANYGLTLPGFAELAKSFEKIHVNLLDLFDLHIKSAEEIITREKLWGGKGLEVFELLADFRKSINPAHEIDPMLYPEILAQVISSGRPWRPKFGTHPRIHMLSPQEARMQPADIVIISGLNEGGFPTLPQADSFMNQQIRAKVGLDQLSRKIGQAAHDFELLSQAETVFYTRSKKEGGSPTVKSRFLQRLQAVCNVKPGDKYCHWAREFYEPATPPQAAKRPEPRPPVEARPTRLSATKVGKLMRDPYVVYAEKILQLAKLPEIDEEVTAKKFGIFIHKALERFSKNYDGKLQTLLEIGAEEFKPYESKIGVGTFWWPKFLRIAEWFIEHENQNRNRATEYYFEQSDKVDIGKMTFTAEADRVEVDGSIRIVDYKTGTPPTTGKVEAGFDPQLAIEAIIFSEKHNKPVSSMEYWHLVGKSGAQAVDKKQHNKPEKLEAIIEGTRKGLTQISEIFLLESTPFIARPWSRFALQYNDYEHLERIKEWDE